MAPAALVTGHYVPSPAGDLVLAQGAAGAAEWGRFLLTEHTTTQVLQEVTDSARAHVPGVAEASLTMVENGMVSSVAWTGLLAYKLDDVQYASGGPCVDAARTGTATWVKNSREDRRWPTYLTAAVRWGALSSFSVPLPMAVDGVDVGLNLYSASADGFSDAARHSALHLARRAGVTVANWYAYAVAVDEAEHLRQAMVNRAVIEQAKGILVLALGVTPEEAFRTLSERSQRSNTKLHDLAAALVARVAAGQGRAALKDLHTTGPDS